MGANRLLERAARIGRDAVLMVVRRRPDEERVAGHDDPGEPLVAQHQYQ